MSQSITARNLAPRPGGKVARIGAALVGVAATALLVAACSSGSSSSAPSTGSSAAGAQATTGGSSSGAASAGTMITTATSSGATFLTDGSGKAVYLWAKDTGNTSQCTGACAGAWPPVTATGTVTAGGSAVASDLGTITRSDGSKQVTYNGHPLYYYVGDSGPGQATGQGSPNFGAKWWLVSPAGADVTAAVTSFTPSSSSGGSSGGGAPSPSSGASSSKAGGGWS